MAACKNTYRLKGGTPITLIGCKLVHTFDRLQVFECGSLVRSHYLTDPCSNDHMWQCAECSKDTPPKKSLQHSPVKQCTNLISYELEDTIRFSNCNHKATKKRTYVCGSPYLLDEKDCTNTLHMVKCINCFKCTNDIVVLEISEGIFSPDCPEKHIFGPGTYKCGENMNFTDCPKNHFIKCQSCRGHFSPITTSTPKILPKKKSSESVSSDEEDHLRNKTLADLAETQKLLKKALNDDEMIFNDKCIDRKHEFETRTKKILAAPAKKFLQAYEAVMMQFDPNEFGGNIPKDFGDELLKEVYDTYSMMEDARHKCLEVLTENDRMNNPRYDQYLRDRLGKKCECQRIHNAYYKNQQNSQNLKPQTLLYDTPLKPPITTSQFHRPKVSQPGGFLHELSDLKSHQPNMLHSQTFIPPPRQRNPITFNHRDSERFPYFKMNDEIMLVEKFDASKPRSYMAFRAQWENFEAKMTRANRSELDKFYALLRVVDGQAKNLINSEYPNNESYRDAMNLLDKLFYEPSNLLRDMIKKLNKVHKMTDSYDSLLQGTISLRKAWTDLNHANLNIEQLKGLLFIATTEKQLSEGSWKIWLDVQNDVRNIEDSNFSFDINHYMHAINLAMTNCCKRENAIGKSLPIENKFKPKSTLYGSYITKPLDKDTTFKDGNKYKQANINGKCVFCGFALHKYQLYCPKLKRSLNPDQIVAIMEKNDINCYLCLGLNHRTKFCESFKDGRLQRCNIVEQSKEKCNRLHCRYLHRYKNKPVSNFTTTNELDNTVDDTVESQN